MGGLVIRAEGGHLPSAPLKVQSAGSFNCGLTGCQKISGGNLKAVAFESCHEVGHDTGRIETAEHFSVAVDIELFVAEEGLGRDYTAFHPGNLGEFDKLA